MRNRLSERQAFKSALPLQTKLWREREEFIDRQQVPAEPYQFSINTDMLDVFADKFELLLSQGDTLQRIFGSSCKPIHAHLARHALHGTRHLFGCL